MSTSTTIVHSEFDDPNKLNLLIGFSGSVASIKAVELVASLRARYNIRVVCTEHSKYFIDVDQLNQLLAVPVYTDQHEWNTTQHNTYQRGDAVLHIELRKWSNLMCISPLSANTLAKLSSGICDNLLTCICRAWDINNNPLIVAPAMNTMMYTHVITAKQLSTLKSYHYIVIDPISKLLACGDTGTGAMATVSTIVDTINQAAQTHQHSKQTNGN